MRRAAQRVGVAIALEETAPRRRGLRLIDIEFRRQFRIARLQRRMHQVARKHCIVLAAAERERDMPRRMPRRRQNAHVVADLIIVAHDLGLVWRRPPAARCRRTAALLLSHSARSSSRTRSCRTHSARSETSAPSGRFPAAYSSRRDRHADACTSRNRCRRRQSLRRPARAYRCRRSSCSISDAVGRGLSLPMQLSIRMV